MKKTLMSLAGSLLILGAVLFTGCSNQSPLDEPSEHVVQNKFRSGSGETLGYINDAGEFVEIDDVQLECFFHETGLLATNQILEDYQVISYLDEQQMLQYVLQATGSGPASQVRIRHDLGEMAAMYFLAEGGGCSCTSTGCTTWGCNVSEAPFPCSCSDCGTETGTCTKTSSRLTSFQIASIFSTAC